MAGSKEKPGRAAGESDWRPGGDEAGEMVKVGYSVKGEWRRSLQGPHALSLPREDFSSSQAPGAHWQTVWPRALPSWAQLVIS